MTKRLKRGCLERDWRGGEEIGNILKEEISFMFELSVNGKINQELFNQGYSVKCVFSFWRIKVLKYEK